MLTTLAEHRREVEELRIRINRADDDMLRLARKLDLTRRKLLDARESLKKIATQGDANSQAEAQRGLAASKEK